MPKNKKTAKSGSSNASRKPKFVYGAGVGSLIGLIALIALPSLAINILIGLLIVAAYVFFITRQQGTNKKWSPHAASPKPILGALVVGIMSVAGVQYLGISLAWNPQGTIKKSVQNVTTNGPVVDANNASSAVIAKPGDTLNYIIVVSNVAPNAANHDNDMAFTVMTDTLPTGIQLVSDPTKRTITENLGTILPGKSVTKTYQVKVVATTNNALIENKACFNADSVVKDNPQNGCDIAIIKTQVPPTPPPTPTPPTPTPPTPTPPTPTPPTPTPPTPTPPTPTPPTPTPTPPTPTPPTPTPPVPTPPPVTPVATEELPNVGARNIAIVVLFAAVIGYIFSAMYGYMRSGKSIRFK